MNNRWLVAIVIISALLNVIVVSVSISERVLAQSSAISMPVLTKGMGYVLTVPIPNPTCVDIEKKLGLKRGDIVSMTNDPLNGTTIQFNKDVTLTSTQVETATDEVKGLIPDIDTK